MKRWEYVSSLVLGAVCLALAITAIVSGRANAALQNDLQAQQIEMNKGKASQQVGTNLLRDIAVAAVKNEKLKALLGRDGFTLSETPAASPSPSS